MYFGSRHDWEMYPVIVFMIVGFLATLGAIGYGLWWLWSHLTWI